MELTLSDVDRAFRDELRAWLDVNLAIAGDPKRWHQALVDGRWAVPNWPAEYCGRNATTTQQILFAEEMGARDAPVPRNAIALFNIGPVLLDAGTEAQRARYLLKMVTAEEIWCQGFSEPSAGSDLASLQTRAELDGDHYVVNGQKVWTTYGPEAHLCLALVRTDPKAAKHKGLSALIVDMRAPGVVVKPLRELTGDAGFSEIFFTNVRVPRDSLVGAPGAGWSVAMSTLKHERLGTIKLGAQLRRSLDGVIALARELGKIDEPWVRHALASAGVQVDFMRLLAERALEAIQRDEDPGACLPLGKLQWASLMQELAELALKLAGPHAQFYRGPHEIPGNWPYHCIYARSMTIAAGTTQVQKNILAVRSLGLPKDESAQGGPEPSRDRRLPEARAHLRDSVRRFLRAKCPTSFVRRMLDDARGTTDEVWTQLVELGLHGILIPEAHGGLGLGWAEMGVVLEEMGRAVFPGPFFSSAVAAVTALTSMATPDEQAELLPHIADGTRILTLAYLDPIGQRTMATREGGAYRLDGVKLAPDGGAADLLLVIADAESGPALFAVRAKDTHVSAIGTLDQTRKQAEIVFRRTEARLLGGGTQSNFDARLRAAFDRIKVGMVADAVGAADRSLELATEYAKLRRQFDRPIGSFQAIQHLLADMLARLELARSGTYEGIRLADGGDEKAFHRAATAVKAYASDALYRATADAIQVFGGIGFTWEHDAHLFYKRVMAMQHAFGGTPEHELEYARLILT